MSLDEDILKLKIWANRLGFPAQDLPNDEALRSIFKQRQSLIFINLMDKVRPKQEVEEIRQNILITKIKTFEKDKIIPAHMRNYLPKGLQRYLKIEELNKKNGRATAKLNETKKEYEKLLASIKSANIQKIQMREKNEELKTKYNLLKLKLGSLTDAITKEEENKEKILSVMPVKIKSGNGGESQANNTIMECLKELEEFYRIYFYSSNSHRLQEAKDELWKKLRKILANVPNFYLWLSILKIKEEQLQNVIAMNKSTLNESKPVNDNVFTPIEIEIMKARANLISIHAKRVAAIEESENLNRIFVPSYLQFVEAVKFKLSLFDMEKSEEDLDEIVSDFVVQFMARCSRKGQMDFLVQEIERYKAEIAKRKQMLKDHHMVLSSIQQIYGDIDGIVQRMQQEISQLNQIKEKIIYSKNMSQYILQDIQSARNQVASRIVKLSSSGDSFEFSDNVLCSTKLDFDNSVFSNISTSRVENSTVISGIQSTLPQHVNEMKIFMEIPIQKLQSISNACIYQLQRNPVITNGLDSLSTIELTPGLLLTAEGSLEHVQKQIKRNKEIQKYVAELKSNITLVDADEPKLKAQRIAQHEEIVELLDKIKVLGINNKRILKKSSKYYKFVLENPLGNYIPPTKLFNNRKYSDYENEFNMYHRMAIKGSSIRESQEVRTIISK